MANPNIEHITTESSNIKSIMYNHEEECLMVERTAVQSSLT